MKAGTKELYTQEELKDEKKNKRTAALTTGLIYLGVLLLFIFLGFRTPLPLPAEEGDIVLLGLEAPGDNPENDFAEGEKDQQDQKESYTPPVETTPQPIQPDPTPAETPTETDQLTSDDPEAPEVEKTAKPKDQPKPADPVEPKKTEPKEEKPKVSDEDLFKGGKKGTGGNNQNNTGTGGDPSGEPDAAKTGKSGSSELGGDGFGFDLAGRNVVKRPSLNEDVQKKGRVVVEIRVDTEGRVVDARPGVRGSTTTDSRLLELARKAALDTRFTRAPNHIVGDQVGTITIEFKLD